MRLLLQSFNWGKIPISYIQSSLALEVLLVTITMVISILIVIVNILNQLLRLPFPFQTYVAMFRQEANCNFLPAVLFLFFLVAGQADEATIDTGNASSHHLRPRYHRR